MSEPINEEIIVAGRRVHFVMNKTFPGNNLKIYEVGGTEPIWELNDISVLEDCATWMKPLDDTRIEFGVFSGGYNVLNVATLKLEKREFTK